MSAIEPEDSDTVRAQQQGRGPEVRVSTRRGTEYVLSTHLTKDQATEIANRLRQHLELATDPYFSPRVVD